MMPEIKVGRKKRESKAEFGARFECEKSKVSPVMPEIHLQLQILKTVTKQILKKVVLTASIGGLPVTLIISSHVLTISYTLYQFQLPQ